MKDPNQNSNESRLELLRLQICGGFYNRRDIVEATASAVIRSQALNILLDRYELENPGLKKNPKLDEIRRKIENGFYDDPNHLAELVEKLIKKLEIG